MKDGGKFRTYLTKEELYRFFAKSGYDRIYIKNLIATDFGFASFDVQDDVLYILSVYGDAKAWKQFFINLGKQLGVKELRFLTKRNPTAWCKLLGNAEIVEYVIKIPIEEG